MPLGFDDNKAQRSCSRWSSRKPGSWHHRQRRHSTWAASSDTTTLPSIKHKSTTALSHHHQNSHKGTTNNKPQSNPLEGSGNCAPCGMTRTTIRTARALSAATQQLRPRQIQALPKAVSPLVILASRGSQNDGIDLLRRQ